MTLQNDLILRAARGEKTERVPVWLMRQAGRILPEYRAVRERLSGFKELATTPALAAEVTIQPVDLLGVDAAIIFSDILVIPEAMGLPYDMIEAKGPSFPKVVQNAQDVDALLGADAAHNLEYVYEALKITKRELNGRVPLIGFAGAPWTILAYMVEGHGSKTFSKAKKMLYSNPELAHALLRKITDATIAYLKQQVVSGADMLQIFDSWAGILSPALFEEFSLKYIREICDAIPEVSITVFAKGANFALTQQAELRCATIGIDWNILPQDARKLTKGKTLQGNLDPCVLYASYDEIRKQTKNMIKSFGKQGYIANLGHGVYADTNADHVRCFIDAVKEFGKA